MASDVGTFHGVSRQVPDRLRGGSGGKARSLFRQKPRTPVGRYGVLFPRCARDGNRTTGISWRGAPYNVAVLPADKGNYFVYILPAQTVEGVYPVGGDIRYLISPDGLDIVAKRRMHQDIINFTIHETSTFSLHTHILSDTPEDSDVFDVLTRRPLIPEYIFTCNFTYMVVRRASIQVVESKACGKNAKTTSQSCRVFSHFAKRDVPIWQTSLKKKQAQRTTVDHRALITQNLLRPELRVVTLVL
jgi:hypothetical protein